MPSSPLKPTLELLAKEGVSFDVVCPWGGWIRMEPDDVLAYLHDKDGYFARVAGVSVETYRVWREAGGPRAMFGCEAATKAGRRCRNIINDGGSMEPAELDLERLYCRVHKDDPHVRRWVETGG